MAKKTEWKKALWEATKEPLRLLLLGVVSFLVSYLADLDVQWAAVGLFILRYADSILHEVGKEKKNSLITGLTRF